MVYDFAFQSTIMGHGGGVFKCHLPNGEVLGQGLNTTGARHIKCP